MTTPGGVEARYYHREADEKIRVLRLIEYVGDRKAVEDCVRKSITFKEARTSDGKGYTITGVTLGSFAEVVEAFEYPPKLPPWSPNLNVYAERPEDNPFDDYVDDPIDDITSC